MLQKRLGVPADGIFGKGTERALRALQEERGLVVDGVAGPDTFVAMGLFDLVLLKRGSKGAAVTRLQQALSIDADGTFGPDTEQAVAAFQKQNALEADGIAGPATNAELKLFGVSATRALSKTGAKLWDDLGEATAGALDNVHKLFSA
jgi:peptidoglycan hydrolase-like protein with peptidoglycan-binding domain